MKLLNLISSILLTGLLLSCDNGQGQGSGINSALNPDEYEKQLSHSTTTQLIDVRTPGEFEQGHLKGAVNYDINSADFETKMKSLDKAKPVFVYCLSGGRSSSAAAYLAQQGFKEVYNLEGGILKWTAAGKPFEEGKATQSQGMSSDDFNKLILTKEYVLVDFNAKWCKPCIKMAPMLDKIAAEKKDKLNLLKIDADENKDLLKQKGIDALPVLELYHNGKLAWKHQGETDESTLLKETGI